MKHFRKIKTWLCLWAACPLTILFTARCQENISAISSMFDAYHQNTIKEKLFVHTDKNFYVTGEIAWFKLYAVDASGHKPLELSKVAYVEILDSGNKHVLQAKIALNNAEGNGSFSLPLTLNSGNYKLRAYTSWMRNFGSEYFFEKDITIVNVDKKIDLPAKKIANKYDLQFFPEGGNLVYNISSKIAFKASDQYGKGIKFTGFLMDNTDTVLTFKPQHAGMGFFTLTPLHDHTYKALIRTESGETIVKNLPGAYPSGLVMSVTDSSDKIRVLVKSDARSPHEIYLFVHTREVVKIARGTSLQDGQAVFIIDKALLGDGISHITVFNDQRQPVCERLYFKKPSKHMEVLLNAGEKEYLRRKKVSINIQAGDTGIPNDSASLSMTVFRLDSLQSPDAPNINSFLLLVADLKKPIEDPNYYFLKDDAGTSVDLDNLMLTNGWRRFKWEDVFKNTKPSFAYVPEFNGAIVAGNVINTSTRVPGSNIEAFLSVPGFVTAFKSAVSDRDGHIKFELKNFYGSSQLILQTNSLRDSAYRVDISDPFSNEFSAAPYPLFAFNEALDNSLLKQSISMQVQNIYASKNLKHFNVLPVDTIPFYIHPDQNYLLDNYTRFTTVEEVLREYVLLVNVKKREGRIHFSLFDAAFHEMFNSDPLVLLDGVPVFDLNKFMEVDPLKLNRLEVLNRKYFLGTSVFNGVLSWTSYKEDMADYEPGANAVIIDYEGLQSEREFYSPVYATEDQRASHIPDFRNVLLWSPHIKLATGSSKEISFYTSDLPGKYFIQIQGLSKSGLAGSQVLTFEVKK